MPSEATSLRRQFRFYTTALWTGWIGAGIATAAYWYRFLSAGESHHIMLLCVLACLGVTYRVYQDRQLIRERLACLP
ncbi:hypothetical protein [Lewinella sp. W8]|uniref:hypothetical protein n=1 Tax=Lewinella sp. W8 TaxID=2528208 RepID=UPI001067E045|nr:hypothetical protein [Lewinella sp. W8]MTB52466.1 hypothetical protein [Lewinella sp. W8]